MGTGASEELFKPYQYLVADRQQGLDCMLIHTATDGIDKLIAATAVTATKTTQKDDIKPIKCGADLF
jgi:hypothetical protein